MKINIQDSSTKQSPLEYFEYLYTRDGIKDLHIWFLRTYSQYDITELVDYNPETETIERWNLELVNGECINVDYSTSFKEIFLNAAKEQFRISRKLINNRVDELLKKDEKLEFLTNIQEKLIWFKKVIYRDRNLNKYSFVDLPINNLIYFIKERFPDYILENSSSFTNKHEKVDFKFNNDKLIKTSENISNTFKWIRDPDVLKLLYTELIRLEFIPGTTEFSLFENSFSGSSTEPLIKIQWLPKARNGHGNNKLLFYLLNQLINGIFLQPIHLNVPLYKILGFVFSDFKNESFKSLKNKRWQVEQEPMPLIFNDEYKLINELINLLKSKDTTLNLS
ncbi:MAG: hypothetical protein IPH98_11095 [Saprospiraceae bacterium]|nr:hypothetical protein [Candidatus Defluviibacterium haderslevense]